MQEAAKKPINHWLMLLSPTSSGRPGFSPSAGTDSGYTKVLGSCTDAFTQLALNETVFKSMGTPFKAMAAMADALLWKNTPDNG